MRLVRCGCSAVVFLLLATFAAAQQGSVVGRVVAADSGAPALSARVQLSDGSGIVHDTVVNDNGEFSFPSVAPGEYQLSVSSDGYLQVVETLALQPRQPVFFEVELPRHTVLTEEVAVSARPPGVDPQATGSSRFLTRRALDAANLPSVVDVPTLAEYVLPGVVISHDNFVHVRGNELSLHQFINGVSFLDNSHRHFTPGFRPQVFETVNMMTGGFPAEFGNRFGGILDVTTQSGRNLNGRGSATLGLGTVESRDGAVDYGGSAGRWGYYVQGGSFSSDRFLNPPEPDELHASGHSSQGVAQIDYQGDRDLVKLFVSGGDSRFDLPNTVAEQDDGRDARRELQSLTGILTWQRILSSQSTLSASLYARNVSDDLRPTSDLHTTFADGSRETRTLGGKVDWFQSLGGHRLKAGVDVSGFRMTEALDFDPRLDGEDPDHHDEEGRGEEGHHPPGLPAFTFSGRDTSQLVGAYVQDRFNPVSNLTVDLGLRLDHLNMLASYTELSPRVGAAYHFPRTGSVVRLAYNRLFSPPPIEYFLLANYLGNVSEDAHDRPGNVKPYQQHHVEAGLSQQLHLDFVFDIAAYHHEGQHAFETSELSSTRLFVATNFHEAKANGLELGMDYRRAATSGLSGRVQYALAKVEFIGPVSGGFAAEEHGPGEILPPAFDQRHTLSSSLVYRYPWRDLQVGAFAQYGSGTPSEQHHDGGPAVFSYLPDHWTVDVNARVDLWSQDDRRLALEFVAANLTNNIYAIAKESEARPLQWAMRRVVSGRLRIVF